MSIGKDIVKAFDYVGRVYEEVSRLFGILEPTMQKNGFQSIGDAGSTWGKSTAYHGGRKHLTTYFQRLYVPAKGNAPFAKTLNINVEFDPADRQSGWEEAMVFCGVMYYDEGWKDAWNQQLLRQCSADLSGFDIEGMHDRIIVSTVRSPGSWNTSVQKIILFALPLVAVESPETVETYLVEASIALYKEAYSEVLEKVGKVAQLPAFLQTHP